MVAFAAELGSAFGLPAGNTNKIGVMNMSDFVLDNAYGAASAVIYSQPIKLGDANALSVELTVVSGTTAATSALLVEISNDLANWSTTGITAPSTNFNSLAAPNFARGNFTGVSGRFARVKVTVHSTGAVVNVSAVPNRV